MDKAAFEPHVQYTVALKTADGIVRPANFYVHRTHADFMIVRLRGDGAMHRLSYADIQRIVAATAVPLQQRYHVPPQLLEERFWKSRSMLTHYASAPQSGK